eukprot:16551-Pyramimonas_sp.AAC.1
MEMAPEGLRNLAHDICQASWDSTPELRDIARNTCERLPHGVRPTWLWTERRTGTDYRPTEDRAPSGLHVDCEELEETEAHAIRKGPSRWTCSLDGYAVDSRATTRMRGSSMRFRGVNDSAPMMAGGEQEVAA